MKTPLADWQAPQPPPRDSLQGRWCRLEPIDPERHEAALHLENRQDREGSMWRWLPYGPFVDPSDYRAWMKRTCLANDPHFYAIVPSTHGHATGLAAYLRIEPRHGVIEVGHLAYSPALQRTAAATEAMFLMMEQAFALGYRRYEWKCNSRNTPSRRAAQRLGFSYEGCFRQHMVVKGESRDTCWYSVIDSEWPALQAAFRHWLAPENFDEQGGQRLALSELTAPLLKARDPELG